MSSKLPAYRMCIAEGAVLPQESRKEFLAAFGRAFERTPQAFHRIEDADLCKAERRIAYVELADHIVAGTIFDRATNEGGLVQLYFKAFFADGSVPGIGRYMVAQIAVREYARTGQYVGACADIRIMPDGKCNQAPARSFTRLGFRPEQVCFARVIGTVADMHLMQSSEDRDSYRFLKISADAVDLSRRARDIISEWSGPTVVVLQ